MVVKTFLKRLIGPRLTRRIRQARMPRFDGPHAKQWWRIRDQTDAGLSGFYWRSRNAPARRAIAETVAALDGNSLLEIGCHAGPNLPIASPRLHRWALALSMAPAGQMPLMRPAFTRICAKNSGQEFGR
jgi:hypothetical protein